MDTKIKASFWSDPAVEALSPEGKLALLWLFTSRISACGWVPASQRRFEFETGSPYQALLDAIKALGEGIVIHDKGLWVRNYIRHQIGDGEQLAKNNMRFPIQRAVREAPDSVRAWIVAEYGCLRQGLMEPLASGAPPQERSGKERSGAEEEGMQGEKPKRRVTPPTDAEWLAALATNAAYAGLDVPTEFAKACVWCETNRRQCGRRFFVGWLNRIERPMAPAANGSRPLRPDPTLNPLWRPADDRWRLKAINACRAPRNQEAEDLLAAGELTWDWLRIEEREKIVRWIADYGRVAYTP